jgi:hypothetical protein
VPLVGFVQYTLVETRGTQTPRWKVEIEADPAANIRKEFVRLKHGCRIVLVPVHSEVVLVHTSKVYGEIAADVPASARAFARNPATRTSSRVINGSGNSNRDVLEKPNPLVPPNDEQRMICDISSVRAPRLSAPAKLNWRRAEERVSGLRLPWAPLLPSSALISSVRFVFTSICFKREHCAPHRGSLIRHLLYLLECTKRPTL